MNNSLDEKSFPQLAKLRLSARDVCALREQGFVSSERRRTVVIFKLRFRSQEQRQRVRYIGTNPETATAIANELIRLQQATRRRGDLRRWEATARRALRETKRQLEPLLAESGFHFYGMQIRRRRGKSYAEEATAHAQ